MQSSSLISITSKHLKNASSNSSLPTPLVLYTYSPNAVRAALNKPKTLNSFDLDIIRSLHTEVSNWNSNPSIKVALFTSNNGRAFCAGGDVKSMYFSRTEPSLAHFPKEFITESFKLYHEIATMKPIQVAIWNGIVIGGGAGITLHAPIRIATDTSIFSMPEAKIGLPLGIGGGYYFPKLKNSLGYFLGLTGYQLRGKEVVQCGLAQHFVRKEKLPQLEKDIMEQANENITVEKLTDVVKKYEELVEGTYPHEELISQVFGKPTLEEVFIELELAKKDNKFAEELLRIMKSVSPTSLRVIFEQLQKGTHLNFEENIKMDVRLSQKMIEGIDNYEGIKALLAGKNVRARWQFGSIYEINMQEVERYFQKSSTDYPFSL